MRFAWLRTKRGTPSPAALSQSGQALLVAYNAIWWVPVVLPPLGLMSYPVGLIVFLAITVARASLNFYRNNILTIDRGERFPLRSP